MNTEQTAKNYRTERVKKPRSSHRKHHRGKTFNFWGMQVSKRQLIEIAILLIFAIGVGMLFLPKISDQGAQSYSAGE